MFRDFIKNLRVVFLIFQNKFLNLLPSTVNTRYSINISSNPLGLSIWLKVFYLIIVLDCLLTLDVKSFFICSFLEKILLLLIPFNFFKFLSFYFFLSLKNLIFINLKCIILYKGTNYNSNIKNNNYCDSNANYIIYFYLALLLNLKTILNNSYYTVKWCLNLLNIYIEKSVKLKYIFKNIIYYFTLISWYTIFKRHSIFGSYRISRQRWVELKTEEVNFIKY